jgi:hypothetical protein
MKAGTALSRDLRHLSRANRAKWTRNATVVIRGHRRAGIA